MKLRKIMAGIVATSVAGTMAVAASAQYDAFVMYASGNWYPALIADASGHFEDPNSGAVVEKSYNPTAKFPTAYVERKDMEYTYNDGDLYHFMDSETYEDVPINKAELSDNFKFVKENMVCKVLSYKGKVFGVEPPNFVELEITDTDPGFRGDTATNVTKPATLETGAEIRVPLFVEIGDIIRIDTRTGEYMERVTNK